MTSMSKLVGVAITLLVLVAVFQIVPMVGDRIDTAKGTLAADSQWNSSVNTDIVEGYDLWGDTASMISLGVIVLIISAAVIKPLMGIGRGKE